MAVKTERENVVYRETNVAGAFLQGNQVWVELWDGTKFMFRECEYLAKADYLRNWLCEQFSIGADVVMCDFGDGVKMPILDHRYSARFF